MRGRQKATPSALAGFGVAGSGNKPDTQECIGPVVLDLNTLMPVSPNGQPTVDQWLSWLLSRGFSPKWFMTLTVGKKSKDAAGREVDLYSEMPAEWFRSAWKGLVHQMNLDVGGANYRRKFKHSYFSYVMTLEYQRRGALHIHAIGDNWIDFSAVHHRFWGNRFGFAWISQIPKRWKKADWDAKSRDQLSAMRYVLKYVLKDGQPLVWIKDKPIDVRRVDLGQYGPSAGLCATDRPERAVGRDVDAEQMELWNGGDEDE